MNKIESDKNTNRNELYSSRYVYILNKINIYSIDNKLFENIHKNQTCSRGKVDQKHLIKLLINKKEYWNSENRVDSSV